VPCVHEFCAKAGVKISHQRLGRTVRRSGEQFQGAAASGGGMRLRALRRELPTEDIVGAYGMAMRKSSRAGFVPPAARPPA